MAARAPTGATAFDGAERAYERARPTYAIEALLTALLLAGCGDLGDVADLAAGTGKLTRVLLPHAHTLVAVEPSPAMRKAFQLALPDVEVIDGRAEAIPLAGRVARPRHRRRGVPLVPARARDRGDRTGAAPGRRARRREQRVAHGRRALAATGLRSASAPGIACAAGPRLAPRARGSALFDALCESAKPHEQELSHAAFIDLVALPVDVNVAAGRASGTLPREPPVELVDELAPRPLVVPIRTRAVAARRRG